jgi:hypothetical protein
MTERKRKTWTKHPSWEEAELEAIRRMYSAWPLEFSLLPGRTRNQVYQQAYRMGMTKGQLIEPMFSNLTPEEWAYFAGIIDGEGTINFYKHNTKNAYRAFVVIANTDVALLEWIRKRFPGGSETWYRNRVSRFPEGGALKDICQLRWNKRSVLKELLTGILPYLVVKRAGAERVLVWASEEGQRRIA